MNMEAVLWIHGNRCRVVLKHDGRIIDTDDTWNNRASAELTVQTSVPYATIRFVTDETEIQELNQEWDAAKAA